MIAEPQPLTAAERVELAELMRGAAAGRLTPPEFNRATELNVREQAAAQRSADAR